MRLDNQWLTVPQAAKLLGRGPRAVQRAIERGALPAQRLKGSPHKIASSVVAELLEAAGQPVPLRRPKNPDATPVRLVEPAGAA